VPPWRRVVRYIYTGFVICLVLVVAGLIGGRDYVAAVAARGLLPAVLFAVASAVAWRIAGRWSNGRLIVYAAWLAVGAVAGVQSGDRAAIEAVWGLTLLGIFVLLPLYLVRRRRPASTDRQGA